MPRCCSNGCLFAFVAGGFSFWGVVAAATRHCRSSPLSELSSFRCGGENWRIEKGGGSHHLRLTQPPPPNSLHSLSLRLLLPLSIVIITTAVSDNGGSAAVVADGSSSTAVFPAAAPSPHTLVKATKAFHEAKVNDIGLFVALLQHVQNHLADFPPAWCDDAGEDRGGNREGSTARRRRRRWSEEASSLPSVRSPLLERQRQSPFVFFPSLEDGGIEKGSPKAKRRSFACPTPRPPPLAPPPSRHSCPYHQGVTAGTTPSCPSWRRGPAIIGGTTTQPSLLAPPPSRHRWHHYPAVRHRCCRHSAVTAAPPTRYRCRLLAATAAFFWISPLWLPRSGEKSFLFHPLGAVPPGRQKEGSTPLDVISGEVTASLHSLHLPPPHLPVLLFLSTPNVAVVVSETLCRRVGTSSALSRCGRGGQ